MVRRLPFLLMLLMPSTVLAGAASPQGVWSGTIGTKAIVACFNKGSPWTAYGSYYYLDHLIPIALHTREKDSYWHEGDTGTWELTAPLNGPIVGTWRNGKTGKALPISLTLVDSKDDETACAQDSYNSRLESRPKIEKGKIVQFSPGRSYRTLRFAGQETVELVGPDPALDKLNTLLALDQSKEAVEAYFQQRREFLGRVGYPAVDEQHTEPTYWDAHFITLRFFSWTAGEGTRGIATEYRTWNVETVEEVDLWNWFGLKPHQMSPRLKRLFLKNKRDAPECQYKTYQLVLEKTGFRFFDEGSDDDCGYELRISFRKALPLLTTAGKRQVEALIGSQ